MTNHQKFCDQIKSHMPRAFQYCDIGARWGLSSPWTDLGTKITSISFEPDNEEFQKLSSKKRDQDFLFQTALSEDFSKKTLYITSAPGSSSLYPPNLELLKTFPNSERFNIEREIEIECQTLDSVAKSDERLKFDFIKIDVQGFELNVLKGARDVVTSETIGLELEVEYLEIYKGQPLFYEVADYVTKELKFDLFRVKNQFWKNSYSTSAKTLGGQLAFGDALFLRSLSNLTEWVESFDKQKAYEKLFMAVITGSMYGLIDYSLSILSHPQLSTYFPNDVLTSLRKEIQKYDKKTFLDKGSHRLSLLFYNLYRKFQSNNGWGYSDPSLGDSEVWGLENLIRTK